MPALIEEIRTYKIKGVEVFSAGEWNKDKYGLEDLYSMVTAFNSLKVGFRPYLKLGHDNKQALSKSSGLPAVGWVERLYVQGAKLLADFDFVPEKIYKLIKSRAYRKVSCEVYWDLDVNGVKYPRVVGAVALLGAENPGVMNLDDILGCYTLANSESLGGVFKAIETQDNFKAYEMEFETNSEDDEMAEDIEKLKAELEDQKKNYTKTQEDLDAKAKELADLKATAQKEKEATEAELKKYRLEKETAEAEAKASKVSEFVTGLETKKLVTPAMKEIITELLSDKKEYSVADKKLTKEQAIEQVLTLSKEAAKVNFDESSKATFGKKADKDKEMNEKIEKYAAEHKCDYAQAYKAVLKAEKPEEETED
jgi:hypothetical protein